MKVTEGQLISAFGEYVDKELMPMAAGLSQLEQFLHGLKLGVAKRKIPALVQNNASLQMLKLPDGRIELDDLLAAAEESMQSVHQIEIAGITFRAEDLRKLSSIVSRYSEG